MPTNFIFNKWEGSQKITFSSVLPDSGRDRTSFCPLPSLNVRVPEPEELAPQCTSIRINAKPGAGGVGVRISRYFIEKE